MNKRVSVCYYPTTIILVDDSRVLLKTIRLSLSDLPCQFYNDPREALQLLNDKYHPDYFTKRVISRNEDASSDQLVFNFDIKNAHRLIYDPLRFSETVAVVVDYAMPFINGLEFCRCIKDKHIKKIMFTGEADETLAIQAFNDKDIDRFIKKTALDFNASLIKIIKDIQKEYFNEISESLLNSNRSENILSILTDHSFIQLFSEICEKNKVVEYYLTDEQGSFLMLDENANPSWLAVVDDEQMNIYHEIAKSGGASNTVLDALKNRTKLPYFFSDEDFEVPPILWKEYLHNANILEGKKRYYYSYINDSSRYHINHEKILPYQKFMERF